MKTKGTVDFGYGTRMEAVRISLLKEASERRAKAGLPSPDKEELVMLQKMMSEHGAFGHGPLM